MKMQTLMTLVVATLSAVAVASYAGEERSPKAQAEKEIQQIEQDWAKALVSRDFAFFDKTIAEEWEVISPGGEIWDKEKFLEPMKSGSLTIESYKLLELKVRVYGQAAVAIGHGSVKGKGKNGEFSHEERWLDVYAKRQGRWQCVAAQFTIVKK